MTYAEIEKTLPEKVSGVAVSLSGGLDSTTLLYLMVKKYGADKVHAISFVYNQRHDIELIQAKCTTKRLGVIHKVIDISFYGDITSKVSSMVKGEVPTPTIQEVLGDPQPSTYQPQRNAIFTFLVAAYAESNGLDIIALGLQQQDSYSYYDTRPEFYEGIQNIFDLNRKNYMRFLAPFIRMSKSDEILLGNDLGVPYDDTWTCYSPLTHDEYQMEPAGGRNYIGKSYKPCGVCPSCAERITAFRKVEIKDPLTSVLVTS